MASKRQSEWGGMNWIRQAKRLAIYMRDGLACAYCGAAIEDGTQLTLDHVKPHSHGGTNEATNLVTACHRCNSARADRPVAQFARTVADYLNHGTTGDEIVKHIRNCQRRTLPLADAKQMIARRGSVSRVLAQRT